MYFEEALAQGSSHRSDSQQKEAMGQTIFGKAKEFGADEKLLSKKLDCLESLLHNYAGINGMKDDFASMMYSSGNKFNMTNTRIKVGVADIVKKNDIKQPEKIDEELQSQLQDIVRGREMRGNEARISIDSFENSSINQKSSNAGAGARGTLTTILTKQNSMDSMQTAKSKSKKLSPRNLYTGSSKGFGKMSFDGGTSSTRQMSPIKEKLVV